MIRIADEFIRDHGGSPSFKNYKGYPYAACISVNDAVVHGFPNGKELKEGDIISVDVGVYKNGFHGDSAYTFAIGDPGEEVLQLMKVTKESLYKGIEKAIAGNRDRRYCICHSGLLRERTINMVWCGNLWAMGLGKHLHEDPQVPNYGKRGSGAKDEGRNGDRY